MKNVYQASATFCCANCNRSIQIFSKNEFVRSYTKEVCANCNAPEFEKFHLDVVFKRNETDEFQPLEWEWAYLDSIVTCCNNCSPMNPIHWTNLKVKCPQCDLYTMKFESALEETRKTIPVAKKQNPIF